MSDKSVTAVFLDEHDKVQVTEYKGPNVGYAVVNEGVVKVYKGQETLIIPVTRLFYLVATL